MAAETVGLGERQQGLLPLVRSLLDPAAYPHPAERVTLVQTHISYVFLAGDYAYKVKKPLALGFLDYSTVERRQLLCNREVVLNRRLCPDVYLGVQPVVATPRGLRVGGEGQVVDWCVVMRRLPEDRLLSALLPAGAVGPEEIGAVARKLAAFHAAAPTGAAIDACGTPESIRVNTDENFAQLRPYVGVTISARQLAVVRAFTNRFLDQRRALLARRVADHRIRDGHGDLHAGSVCLAEDVYLFDCVEFNDRFRYGDVAAEVAFLAMDLDRHGRADLGWHFVAAYRQASGDPLPDPLLAFYRCYRATVRAKVESFKLDQPDFDDKERSAARASAETYADLAYCYAGGIARPTLVLTCGLMATGKTTLADALARHFGLVYRSSDATRKALAGLKPTEHRYQAFSEGLYAEDVSRRTYAALLNEAETWLGRGLSVILDASYKRRSERVAARKLATRLGVGFLVLECTCPEETIHARVAARLDRPGEVSDARWDLFEQQKHDFDPCTELPDAEHLLIRTDRPVGDEIAAVRRRLEVAREPAPSPAGRR